MRINSKRNKALQQVKETKKVRFSERFSHLLKTIIATQGGYLADKLFLFESDNNQGFTFEVVKRSPIFNILRGLCCMYEKIIAAAPMLTIPT